MKIMVLEIFAIFLKFAVMCRCDYLILYFTTHFDLVRAKSTYLYEEEFGFAGQCRAVVAPEGRGEQLVTYRAVSPVHHPLVTVTQDGRRETVGVTVVLTGRWKRGQTLCRVLYIKSNHVS